MKNLILASASPRRKQLLSEAGYQFSIQTSQKEGEYDKITPPEKFAVRCAINKAEDVFSRQEKSVVLAADTIVCLDGHILEKPVDAKDAGKENAQGDDFLFHQISISNPTGQWSEPMTSL